MEKMPEDDNFKEYRSKDRWTPVKRNVVYINSKCEIGVFERYFYQISTDNIKKRLEDFHYEAGRLKRAIVNKNYQVSGNIFVFENKLLNADELAIVNQILGQKYKSARYVLHRFYDRAAAPTVIFENDSRIYSEAFAGSGELAIVTSVLKIRAAKDYDLILIDEPETSLHPQAQINLTYFLLQQIQQKHLQIVISTHSPTLVDILPASALKVLYLNKEGKAAIINDAHPSMAFHRLGHIDNNKKITLFIEDSLLHEFIQYCLRQLDIGLQSNFSLQESGVGVDEVFNHLLPSWINSPQNIYFFADGDQSEKINKLPDTAKLTGEQKKELKNELKKMGFTPTIKSEDADTLIKYINWIKNRVFLINAECPEYIFLSLYADAQVAEIQPKTNQQYKIELSKFLKEKKSFENDISAKAIGMAFRAKLADAENNPYVEHVKQQLMTIANRANSPQ